MVLLSCVACWLSAALALCAAASCAFSAASSWASVVSFAVSIDRLCVSSAICSFSRLIVLSEPVSAEERNASANTNTSSTKMVTMRRVDSAST